MHLPPIHIYWPPSPNEVQLATPTHSCQSRSILLRAGRRRRLFVEVITRGVLNRELKKMAEEVKGHGKVKDKGKVQDKAFVWTEPLTVTLLKVCKEYHGTHGYGQAFDWSDIKEGFEKKTGLKVRKDSAKNKVEHMKKLWRAWSDLRFKVTGAGWDEKTGMVTLDDEWWDRQRKEKTDKYSQFRKKGVTPELSDLWDDVFNQIVATGRHVVSPSMDPNSIPICIGDDDGDGSDSKDSLERTLDNDREEDEEDLQAIASRVNLDLPYEQCLASIHKELTTPTPSKKSVGASQSKGKSTRITTSSQAVSTKRRRKQAPAATAFNEHMALVGETSKKMLSLMEGDLGSTADAQEPKKYAYADIILVLDRMVREQRLIEESKLWCFAVSQLALEHRREVFMALPKDSNRIAWLQYEYELAYNIYQP